SSTSTKLKVMGVELMALGAKDALHTTDEVVTYAEPARGVYKKLIVRDGHLAGAILLGDTQRTSRLLQAFHRNKVRPSSRAGHLLPQSATTENSSIADAPDTLQVCNCNGVSKGTIVAAIKDGRRSLKALCEGTRAGTGCGSCKSQVEVLLEACSDGLAVEDPSIHYYVPAVPFTKPELIRRIKEQNLRSVSAVLTALSGGKEDAKSKIGLASLLKTIWSNTYEDERDARFINDRVHANIQKDGTFSVVPRIWGGVVTPQELRSIANA